MFALMTAPVPRPGWTPRIANARAVRASWGDAPGGSTWASPGPPVAPVRPAADAAKETVWVRFTYRLPVPTAGFAKAHTSVLGSAPGGLALTNVPVCGPQSTVVTWTVGFTAVCMATRTRTSVVYLGKVT